MDEIKETKALELLEKISEALQSKPVIDYPEGSVPIEIVARVYRRDASWVRAGIIAGWLPIGVATRNGEQVTDVNDMDSRKGRINYFISPKKLYEQTGYMWEGKSL